MRLLHVLSPVVRWLPIVFLVAVLEPGAMAWASTQKQVLVLYSTRRDAQASILGDRELPRILEDGLGGTVDYYAEYIDLGRFPDPGYQSAFSDFLRLKYKGHQFDLVVALQDVAVQFAASRRSELFPDTPLVFLATAAPAGRVANTTGLVAELDLAGTLSLAAALQPDVRQVFVVSGADNRDKSYESMARAQLRPFETRLAITYLAGLPTKDLEARLAALPAHSIVYYLIVNRDGAGESFHPLEYVDRLSAVSSAPIYCWVDSAMDRGIVGGNLKALDHQTEALGGLALRVLRGERADSIPISSANLNVNQVDWRQLRRWGISEARVPAGTLIRFREPSAWERYKFYILGTITILVAQTALIAGLLVQRWRRQQAEERARANQAALVTSYDRIRALGSRLLIAQDSERSRIARELHDDISQQLALLAIDLELLNGAARADAGKLAGEALDRAQRIAKSVHDLSHRLHPAKLRLIGLVSGLQALQRELSRPDIAVVFTHENVPPAIAPELTLCLFRVVQEAVQNALKYSDAREVSVHLRGGPEGLTLTVADGGVGFDIDALWGKGLGLISMSERLEAIGGALEIRSAPGAGTRLHVTVPLQVVHPPESAAV